jgi:hypothetical protein
MTKYAIVTAQGWYGDYTQVWATFATLAEADAYARRGRCVVLEGEYEVGERVHREDARRYEQRADGTRRAEGEAL